MARYTAKLIAAIKHAYEETDRPVDLIASDFDVSSRNIQRLVVTENWKSRRVRKHKPRDVPVALELLAQAQALAVLPPPERGRSDREAIRVGVSDSMPTVAEQEETPTLTLPLSGGGNSSAIATETASAAAESDNRSAIDRLEALVLKEIEAEEQGRNTSHGPRIGDAERSARTLATLTQTLHTLQRMRAGLSPEQEISNDDIAEDDMPRDIDEFRRDLARRIDAFVASRTGGNDARRDTEPRTLDGAG